MPVSNNPNIYTVSRLNADVRLLLENEMGIVWLVGELSNLSTPVSGHWYFSLKDARAQVKCAMFKGNNRRVTFKPANGQQVLVKARLSLYEPRGDYQLIVDSMQPEGDGRLQQEFDALKMKLAAEGLFAQASKQALPENPKAVGIVTSKTGAALYDILDVLKRRDPSLPVVIYPTQVQGKGAEFEIAQAIGRANQRNEVDVLIVGRGGGSMEDLWCFNEEIVARTIVSSQIPIISAVGHEIDVTIADFVADSRAPTPSAAAEIVSRDNSHKTQAIDSRLLQLKNVMSHYLLRQNAGLQRLKFGLDRQHPQQRLQSQSQRLDELTIQLQKAMQRNLVDTCRTLDQLTSRFELQSPTRTITDKTKALNALTERLESGMRAKLTKHTYQYQLLLEKLDAYSPLATLTRGYSITFDAQNKVVTDPNQVTDKDVLVTRVAGGNIRSVVKK